MKKKVFVAISFLLVCFFLQAQNAAKVVYAEVGGPGIASLNFDMRFANKEDGWGFRAGIGGFSIDNAGITIIPVGINYITSKDKKNYFELGAGISLIGGSNNSSSSNIFSNSFGHFNIGYRLQPANGGYFFRATITPIFGNGFFWPYYGGVSFGYKF